jgi:nucleotide-binding universal stress UspA family protein
MKTILAPTDFSKIARNAIDYSVELAKITGAKIILFNVFQIPMIPAEVPIMLPIDEIQKNTMDALNKIKKDIISEHTDNLLIECKCISGFPVEEINRSAKENKVDIIIMGMAGAGYLTEKLIGSITTSLIKKAKCPVLAIDKYVKFRRVEKIVLACDYAEIDNKCILEPLEEFVYLFKAHLYILNIIGPLERVTMSKAVSSVKLERLLEGTSHSFHYKENEDVVKGINDFVEENKIDMVVMIPRIHNVFKNFFQEPHTKSMAFHTKIPLLALHE